MKYVVLLPIILLGVLLSGIALVCGTAADWLQDAIEPWEGRK